MNILPIIVVILCITHCAVLGIVYEIEFEGYAVTDAPGVLCRCSSSVWTPIPSNSN